MLQWKVKKSASPAVTASNTPSLSRRKSSAQVILPDAKRRKSTIDQAHSRKASINLPKAATSIDALPSNRQPAVKAITGKAKSVIDSLVKEGLYRIPDGATATTLSTSLALEIENALSALHADPSAYAPQFRAILMNIPRNSQLVLQLLMGDLSPLEIAEMSSDDMASEEVQRERIRRKEEADKHSILISETGPRVRKTHKGDEVIGGVDEGSRMGGGDDSAAWTRVARRDTIDEGGDGDVEMEDGDAGERVELDEDESRHPPPPSLSVDTKRKSSTQTYDMNRAWNAAHSPDQATYSRAQPAHIASRGGDTQMHDADIDRLLKDEEDEDIPPSPVIDGSPGAPVWKGRVDMAGVAAFSSSARWIAGCDISHKIPYTTLLPSKLDITGRIAVARADEYVSGMRFSSSNDVCCLDITPRASQADRGNFEKIYSYFEEKGRWGVLDPRGLGEGVRDAYLVTLKSGQSEYPEFLDMLKDRMIEEPRGRDMLVLTLVVKTRSPLSTPAPASGVPAPSATPQLPQQSPVVPPASSNGTTPAPAPAPLPSTANTNYPWATPLIRDILGPHISAPAVVQLFTAVPEMSEVQVRNLRQALDENPSAREDLGVLGLVLQQGQGQGGQSQG